MQHYFHRKVQTSIFLLAFASGLPLVLTGATLQAWYTVSGLSLAAIGWLTLIGQPYAYKFLWAPFLDRYAPFGCNRRKSWMLLAQFSMTATLIVMAFCKPAQYPVLLAMVALSLAVFSATFDTVFDAYRTEVLSEAARGIGTSIYTIAYRLAMILASAGALMFAAKLGWRVTYLFMAVLMGTLSIATLYAPSTQPAASPPLRFKESVIAPLRVFFSRKKALLILAFILLYKLPDAMALSLNTTFLIRKMQFSLMEIGSISKTVGLTAALLGSVLGGILLPRMGVIRALWIFGILQCVSNLLYVWLVYAGKNILVMSISLFGENFCSGLSTVAFVVFLMGLCDQRYTATHYALFSAIASLGRIFIGPIAAMLIKHMGWADFYILSTIIGAPMLVLLYKIQGSTQTEISSDNCVSSDYTEAAE